MKKTIRGFRKYNLKEKYEKVYGTKFYHWIFSSKRSSVRKFFTEDTLTAKDKDEDGNDIEVSFSGFGFPGEFVDRYEAIFYKLIHHTEEVCEMKKNGIDVDTWLRYETLIEEVFGNKPNKKNLTEFFKIEPIQALFWPNQGPQEHYFSGDYIKEIPCCAVARKKLVNLLRKVVPSGFSV